MTVYSVTVNRKKHAALPKFHLHGQATALPVIDNTKNSGHILARMAYEVIFSPESIEDLQLLRAVDRSAVLAAIETHLRREPCKCSKTRIKRLRGLRQPEYRLRVDHLRVYYDVAEADVNILAVLDKAETDEWLVQHGIPL